MSTLPASPEDVLRASATSKGGCRCCRRRWSSLSSPSGCLAPFGQYVREPSRAKQQPPSHDKHVRRADAIGVTRLRSTFPLRSAPRLGSAQPKPGPKAFDLTSRAPPCTPVSHLSPLRPPCLPDAHAQRAPLPLQSPVRAQQNAQRRLTQTRPPRPSVSSALHRPTPKSPPPRPRLMARSPARPLRRRRRPLLQRNPSPSLLRRARLQPPLASVRSPKKSTPSRENHSTSVLPSTSSHGAPER